MHIRTPRRSRGVIALLAVLALLLPVAPMANAQEAGVGDWVETSWGRVRLTGVSGATEATQAGDVIKLAYRFEGNMTEVTNIEVASDDVVGVEACGWQRFPARPDGYNCGYTAATPQDITYEVTAEDIESGEAVFSTRWTPVSTTGTYETLTVTTRVPVGEQDWPELEEGVARTLAAPGDFGFTCHRIPALTQLDNGWILASWDGRPGGCADAPQANSILQRVSKDGGETWEAPTTIAAGFPGDAETARYGYSDPSYVVDRETGTIFNFFVKSYDVSFQASRPGVDPDQRDVLHAVVVQSDDNGETWSEPRNITADITSDVDNWRSRFAASGEGIQLRYGEHAGRLLQQYTIATVEPATYRAVTVYSDDHGATWQVGEPVGTGMDENKVVELSDGTVMLNSRRSDAVGGRKVALSTDGGHSYGEVIIDHALVDPRNNASIIRAFPDAPEGSPEARMLLFSNAASSSSRSNGTIRISLDDGRTWAGSKVFEPETMQYSTLTPLNEPGTYGLLFEGAGPTIKYMQISLDWLEFLPVQVGGEQQEIHRGDNTVAVTLTNLTDDSRTVQLSAAGEAQWVIGDVEPVVLAGGATATVQVPVTVPTTADPHDGILRVTAESDGLSSAGQVPLSMVLREGQNPSVALPVTLVSELPAQPGEGPERMFDGDVETLWHTPWQSSAELPLDIDLQLDEAGEVAFLRHTPRADGPNGRVRGYEIHAGQDPDSLELVAEGEWPNAAGEQIVPIGREAGYVRLRILSTYGDQSGRVFASVAELALHALVADDPAPDPTEDPTDPGEEPTDPAEEPTDPAEEPTDPTDDPSTPGGDPTGDPTAAPAPTVAPSAPAPGPVAPGDAQPEPTVTAPIVRPGLPATGN